MNVNSAASNPPFLPTTLPSTSALSITLTAISASPTSTSSPSQSQAPSSIPHHPTSLHTPSSPLYHPHLPAHHQVVTPTSTSLILTAPPTPSSSCPSPSSFPFPSPANPLASLPSEDRFLPLRLVASSPTLQSDVFHLLSSLYYPFLSPPLPPTLNPSSLLLTPITGGITNTLLLASLHPPHPRTPVLIRVFGLSTEQVIDRLTEQLITVALSKAGVGVRLWGHFETGRLEEWLEGVRPLEWEEMAGWGREVGWKVAELHQQRLDGVAVAKAVSPLYSTLVQWMKGAKEVSFEPGSDKAKLLASIDVGGFWQVELDATLQLLSASAFSQEALVFCHNDLLSGNILVQQHATAASASSPSSSHERTQLWLVDLEYSAFNFAAFDIANHFLEMCGFECRWEHFPTEEQRRTFLTAYLGSMRGEGVGVGDEGGKGQIVEREVEAWDEKVRGFLVLSHLWWGIWAIMQAKHSAIEFDYLGYSALRKAGYLQMKQQSWDVLTAHPR